jgi:hypothetical protein
VTFTEDFATAFKVRGVSGTTGAPIYGQTTPGLVYYSESGLEIAVDGGEAGAADAPTELQTTITGIPSGVTLYADTWALSSASVVATVPGQLGYSDATMISPKVGTEGVAASVAVTTGVESSVTLVWQITNTNSSAIDSLAFKIYAAFTGQPGTPGSPTPNVTAAALSGFSPEYAAYTSTGPIPQFSSTVNVPTTPTNLFTVSLCQTYLLFPYVTDFTGFDTGIAISNTSLDPWAGTSSGASAQPGACQVTFFGAGGIATTLGTSGIWSSTEDMTLTSGLIQPGQTWAFSVSSIDPGYASTATYGTTGYAIATCNFQYAHGYSFVSDFAVRNFAAAYLALIIPDAPRAPQPFTCSANGGSCLSQTGEQLVH